MKGKIDNTQVDSVFICGYTSVPNWEFPLDNIGKIGPDPLQHAVNSPTITGWSSSTPSG